MPSKATRRNETDKTTKVLTASPKRTRSSTRWFTLSQISIGGFILIDGVLHALNEEDPVESFIKFLRYNAPELLKRLLKEIG